MSTQLKKRRRDSVIGIRHHPAQHEPLSLFRHKRGWTADTFPFPQRSICRSVGRCRLSDELRQSAGTGFLIIVGRRNDLNANLLSPHESRSLCASRFTLPMTDARRPHTGQNLARHPMESCRRPRPCNFPEGRVVPFRLRS